MALYPLLLLRCGVGVRGSGVKEWDGVGGGGGVRGGGLGGPGGALGAGGRQGGEAVDEVADSGVDLRKEGGARRRDTAEAGAREGRRVETGRGIEAGVAGSWGQFGSLTGRGGSHAPERGRASARERRAEQPGASPLHRPGCYRRRR